MYELYTVHPWFGTETRMFETIEEVVRTLLDEGYQFKWHYGQGRPILRENECGECGRIAQVFRDGMEVTNLPIGRRANMDVLY